MGPALVAESDHGHGLPEQRIQPQSSGILQNLAVGSTHGGLRNIAVGPRFGWKPVKPWQDRRGSVVSLAEPFKPADRLNR
jgi:hypothetical protein